MADFQRVGSVSNAHVGSEFERLAVDALAKAGICVEPHFLIDVGISSIKKPHKFDLGTASPPTLVECKSHRWTAGSNVPSAKMTVWNEAMYYFACVSDEFRRILFVLHDLRSTSGESLAQYYVRTYQHLIPPDVEIWEYNLEEKTILTHCHLI